MNPIPRHVLQAALATTLLLGPWVKGSPAQPPAASPWPMFQHDAQNTGRTDINGPAGPNVKIQWMFKADARVRTGPSVGADGTLYQANNRKRLITALDPASGAKIWDTNVTAIQGKLKAADPDMSQPAISIHNGQPRAYIGARDNNVWVIDLNTGVGISYWHVPWDGDVTTPITIGPDQKIHIGSGAIGRGLYYSLSDEGAALAVQTENRLIGSLQNAAPALSTDGNHVFVSLKRDVVKLENATGNVVWRCRFPNRGIGGRRQNYSAVIYNDGVDTQDELVIFVAGKDGLMALDPNAGSDYDCAPVWNFVAPYPLGGRSGARERVLSAPALGADGTLYVGASKTQRSAHFYAIDILDGSIKWEHANTERGQYVNNQAAVDASNRVYVPFGGKLFAFDGAGDGNGGSRVLWTVDLPSKKLETGAVVGTEGAVYAGSGRHLVKVVNQ